LTGLYNTRYLDFIIISARHKERLLLVEIHSAHRSVVFVKLLQEGAHPVVPQLHTSLSVIIITLQKMLNSFKHEKKTYPDPYK
jgi:hypothetical protein